MRVQYRAVSQVTPNMLSLSACPALRAVTQVTSTRDLCRIRRVARKVVFRSAGSRKGSRRSNGFADRANGAGLGETGDVDSVGRMSGFVEG